MDVVILSFVEKVGPFWVIFYTGGAYYIESFSS